MRADVNRTKEHQCTLDGQLAVLGDGIDGVVWRISRRPRTQLNSASICLLLFLLAWESLGCRNATKDIDGIAVARQDRFAVLIAQNLVDADLGYEISQRHAALQGEPKLQDFFSVRLQMQLLRALYTLKQRDLSNRGREVLRGAVAQTHEILAKYPMDLIWTKGSRVDFSAQEAVLPRYLCPYDLIVEEFSHAEVRAR